MPAELRRHVWTFILDRIVTVSVKTENETKNERVSAPRPRYGSGLPGRHEALKTEFSQSPRMEAEFRAWPSLELLGSVEKM